MKVEIACIRKDMVTIWRGQARHIVFMPHESPPPKLNPVCEMADGTIVFPFAEAVTVRRRLSTIWIRRA